MGAFFCTDVMPSADKLSRCLLPQSARSTVLQERLPAGRPAGARPRGSCPVGAACASRRGTGARERWAHPFVRMSCQVQTSSHGVCCPSAFAVLFSRSVFSQAGRSARSSRRPWFLNFCLSPSPPVAAESVRISVQTHLRITESIESDMLSHDPTCKYQVVLRRSFIAL